ncbi:hypothetical protein [Devosia sp. RR2S18]|nr:hypothetical protein [Devosia sp. RR2S18]WIJ23926.1 hypothetical protein QOV41_12855 [Devosia sp. RR2S18]
MSRAQTTSIWQRLGTAGMLVFLAPLLIIVGAVHALSNRSHGGR